MRAKIPDRTCVLITRVCAIITLRCISFFERATMTQCLGKTVEHVGLQLTAEDRQ